MRREDIETVSKLNSELKYLDGIVEQLDPDSEVKHEIIVRIADHDQDDAVVEIDQDFLIKTLNMKRDRFRNILRSYGVECSE